MNSRLNIWGSSTGDRRGFGLLIERTIEFLVGTLLMLLMTLTCADVVGRYLFLAPIAGTHELTALGMGVLVFLALPLVTDRGEHVSITVIDRWLPKGIRRAHYGAVQAISTMALIFLGWRIFETAAYLGTVNETTTFLKLPISPFAYLLSAMAMFSAMINALNLARVMRALVKPSD